MGCTQSKAVPAPTAAAAAPSTVAPTRSSAAAGSPSRRAKPAIGSEKRHVHIRSSSDHSLRSHGTGRSSGRRDETRTTVSTPDRSKANGGSLPASSAASMKPSSSPSSPPDGHWKALWRTLPHPVDPADVPSVIDELMARQVNQLNPTEITFLQRRIRSLVKSLPRTAQNAPNKMMGRFLKDQAVVESRSLVDKQHLLDEHVLRKLWTSPSSAGPPSEFSTRFGTPPTATVDTVGSAFVLLAHLSEPLWERAAAIAVDSAQGAGLQIDANHKKEEKKTTAPSPPALMEYASDGSLAADGVTFHSVCFLVSLALRGSRIQRLQLLFYLMLPPNALSVFLAAHPAGGIPSWLLEVDNGIVLSLASMTHYYYFGEAFMPIHDGFAGENGQKKPAQALRVAPLAVMEAIANVLTFRSERNGGFPESSIKTSGSVIHRNRSNKRLNYTESDSQNASISETINHDSMVMEFMLEVRDGRIDSESDPTYRQYMESFWNACESRVRMTGNWTMEAFVFWANEALNDDALDALMRRLFANDTLPSSSAERQMVLKRWQQWQQADARWWSLQDDPQDTLDYLSHSVRKFFHLENVNPADEITAATRVWGGIGGFDGRGGLGHGIMYCIEQSWWSTWENYVGWNWEADLNVARSSRVRPGALSTEQLLDRTSDSVVAGTLGSYELMKTGMIKGVDYVLVPPGVWDILYELYGGGPPLPRMVLPPLIETRARTFSTDSKQMEEEDMMMAEHGVEVTTGESRLLRIPEAFGVAAHPWVFQCHVCDSQQPYRRGDAGPMSIRVMATPDQPLWRLYAEVIVRLPIQNAKAMDKDGRGQARLWRQIEPIDPKDPSSRYGPWGLLCKNRSAVLPVANLDLEFEDNYKDLSTDWRAYADHATVEGIGLVNGDRIMLEYAIQNKAGVFIWPREAAAKASRMRRLADDDLKFRRLLRGVDDNDALLSPPPVLVGTTIDAMDVSGRWFQVDILQVRNDSAEGADEESQDDEPPLENVEKLEKPVDKQIRVDFTEFGGHSEWISVDSDRLASAGRFTMGKADEDTEEASSTNGKNGSEAKAKTAGPVKKAASEVSDQNGGKVCTLPGYGACGLANLGNTCYANSAIQCISYMPLLRAYLLSAQYKATGDLNKDNPLGTGGKLLEEFAELLRVMWSGKHGERSPTRFRGQLGKARSQFSGADQQDAQELLNYMLDVLHEDSNKVKKKPYVEALEDDWVKNNNLQRVGEEAWRRFLRRNRSVMADVAMGQVLNTVTCPVCNFSSRNFDPFNLLSIPFPTVADVVFLCTVVRRGTALNSPHVLNRPKKGEKKSRFDRKKLRGELRAPSNQLVVEQYAIAMSRLADIGDLKLRLQNISGIPANKLKLCKLEEPVAKQNAEESPVVKTYMKISSLPDKEGPCVQVAKGTLPSSDEAGVVSSTPTKIVAFEITLHPRPAPSPENGDKAHSKANGSHMSEDGTITADEDEEDDSAHNESSAFSFNDRGLLKEQLQLYGDKAECRLFDTDPLLISKAISRSLWPETDREFKLGLRVDAIDHRDHWFPGSVVEIIEGVTSDVEEEKTDNATKTKVRIHFDNFSSKWDETYTIDHFTRGKVRPLYSHATPRVKPTEFLVYHRHTDRAAKANALFGQPFYLQCENEWSAARAGAHILAQAARFLQRPDLPSHGPIDVDEIDDSGSNMVQRIYDKAQSTVSDLIDLLVECDRGYVRAALGISHKGHDLKDETYRNTEFDPTAISTTLVKKVNALLPRLPFEVRVCTSDMPLGGGKSVASNEECPFPFFSLMRTIGNYMNARHVVVLHWREPPVDKKHNGRSYLNAPVMYVEPPVVVHKSSAELLEENDSGTTARKNNPGSGGMHLRVCLTEFCKVQKLDLSDCWRCPRCKEYREGKQHMDLWRLPDLLTFHIKRFNCSARWREKITTKVNFPLTGLDMSEWCHSESQSADSNIYDLIGVLNHYGGMTGGHYVATCKATACGPDGREEVAYSFPGAGINVSSASDETDRTGWRLGGIRKEKEMNQSKLAAAASAKYASESSEPLWLQFDDDLVEPIPPRNVVSEMAYVLFYRRRRLTPANIAKYSTLE